MKCLNGSHLVIDAEYMVLFMFPIGPKVNKFSMFVI